MYRGEDEYKMQSRELRLKNLGWMMAYMAWFGGVIAFIMYRLKSDDLDDMEKQAQEKIRINRRIKELNKERNQ